MALYARLKKAGSNLNTTDYNELSINQSIHIILFIGRVCCPRERMNYCYCILWYVISLFWLIRMFYLSGRFHLKALWVKTNWSASMCYVKGHVFFQKCWKATKNELNTCQIEFFQKTFWCIIRLINANNYVAKKCIIHTSLKSDFYFTYTHINI